MPTTTTTAPATFHSKARTCALSQPLSLFNSIPQSPPWRGRSRRRRGASAPPMDRILQRCRRRRRRFSHTQAHRTAFHSVFQGVCPPPNSSVCFVRLKKQTSAPVPRRRVCCLVVVAKVSATWVRKGLRLIRAAVTYYTVSMRELGCMQGVLGGSVFPFKIELRELRGCASGLHRSLGLYLLYTVSLNEFLFTFVGYAVDFLIYYTWGVGSLVSFVIHLNCLGWALLFDFDFDFCCIYRINWRNFDVICLFFAEVRV